MTFFCTKPQNSEVIKNSFLKLTKGNFIIEQGTQKGPFGVSHVFSFRYIEFAIVVEYSGGDFKESC